MTLYEITARAASLLRLGDAEDEMAAHRDYELNGGEEPTLGEDAQILIESANTVIGEIACDFLPLKCVEDVTVGEDKAIRLASLQNEICDIFALKDGSGKPVRFESFYDRLVVAKSGTYRLAYSKMPPEYRLSDTVCYTKTIISTDVIAFGTARDFCLISGRTDEANIWEQRFKAELESKIMPKSLQKMKARGWY